MDNAERESLLRMLAFCLEQLGGSVALDPVDQDRVFASPFYKQVETFKTDSGMFIVKVVQ